LWCHNDAAEPEFCRSPDRRFVRVAHVAKSGEHFDLEFARLRARRRPCLAENRPKF
jgi:hypothetical protein